MIYYFIVILLMEMNEVLFFIYLPCLICIRKTWIKWDCSHIFKWLWKISSCMLWSPWSIWSNHRCSALVYCSTTFFVYIMILILIIIIVDIIIYIYLRIYLRIDNVFFTKTFFFSFFSSLALVFVTFKLIPNV